LIEDGLDEAFSWYLANVLSGNPSCDYLTRPFLLFLLYSVPRDLLSPSFLPVACTWNLKKVTPATGNAQGLCTYIGEGMNDETGCKKFRNNSNKAATDMFCPPI